MRCWSEEPSYGAHRRCLCCHVRTATVCLGVYNVIVDILNICVTLTLVIRPDLSKSDVSSVTPSSDNADNNLVYNLSQIYNVSSLARKTWTPTSSDAHFIKLMVNFLTAIFSFCLIYGTIKVRPKYLLPYFCIQLFDFCISCLGVVGCFTNEANIRIFFLMQEWLPLREQLLSLSSGWLMFIAGILAIVYLWIKAYLINIVWSCYKYLYTLRRVLPTVARPRPPDATHGRAACQSPIEQPAASSAAANTSSADAQSLLPPKYEDITALNVDAANFSTPPPSYDDATASANAN